MKNSSIPTESVNRHITTQPPLKRSGKIHPPPDTACSLRWLRLVCSSALAACAFVPETATAGLPGDINRDGRVNFADYRIYQKNFNQPGGSDQGDINGDGLVNTADFQAMQPNYNKVSPPPTLGGLNAVGNPDPGDILHIVGQGFDGNPDNHCAIMVSQDGRFFDIETLATDQNNLFGTAPEIPPAWAGIPLMMKIAVGDGRRIQIIPDFPDVIAPPDQWVWANFPLPVQPVGVLATPVVINPIPNPLGGFHSGPPMGGTLMVTIDADWGAGTRVCISARVLRADAKMGDTRLQNAVFTGAGTKFDCAVRICDLLRKMFAAHPVRPIAVNCSVSVDTLGNAKITLSSTDGTPIVGGNIDITIKPQPPIITAVSPLSVFPGDLVHIQGQNLPGCPDDVCIIAVGADGHIIPMEAVLADGNNVHARIPAIGVADLPHGPFNVMIGAGEGIRPKIRQQLAGVEIGANPWLWQGAVANMAAGPVINVNAGPLLPPFVRCFDSGPPVAGQLCLFIDEDWGSNTEICLTARILKQTDNGCDINFSNIKFTAGGTKLACAAKICDILKATFQSRGRPVLCSITDFGNTVKITLRCASGKPIVAGKIQVKRKQPPIIIDNVTISASPAAGSPVVLVGRNLPGEPDNLCFLMQADDGQQIAIDITTIGTVPGGGIAIGGVIPFVPADAAGKAFKVMIGAGVGIRAPIIPEFGNVQVLADPWRWAGEPAEGAVWPVAVLPVFVPPANLTFTSVPPLDGKICLFINQDWPAAGTKIRLYARIHKPCDMGCDINFQDIRIVGGGTKFDCAVRICSLLQQAFDERGRPVRCNVSADALGNAKITLQCTGPEKLNAGKIVVEILPLALP